MQQATILIHCLEIGVHYSDRSYVKARNIVTDILVECDRLRELYGSEGKPVEVVTLPLPDVSKSRGRPRTGKAQSNAERQRKHREKQAFLHQSRLESASQSFASESDAELLEWLVTAGASLQEKAWLELGRRKCWKLP